MPIYEYLCQTCHKRSSLLILSLRNPQPIQCRHCGGAALDRLLSRFASPKSEEARLESLTDSSNLGGLDEDDPQSVARFMKKMGKEMGEDAGHDMEAMMEQAETNGNISADTDND